MDRETLTTGIPVSTNNLPDIFSKNKIAYAVIQEVKVDGKVVGREIVESRDERGRKLPELTENKLELSSTASIPLPPPPDACHGIIQGVATPISSKESEAPYNTETTVVSAIDVIQALHANANPLTGEVFSDDFILNSPQIHSALGTALASLEHYKRFLKRKSKLPAKAGEDWTPEEDEKLLEAYEKGSSIKELSILHQRTQGAIQSRLMQNGKFDPKK